VTALRPAALALALLAAAPSPAAGGRLGLLEAPVAERRASLGGEGGADARTLDRALAILGSPGDDLLDDLRDGSRVAGPLDRRFPADPLLEPALEDCWTVLRDDALAERAALVAWMGRTGSDRGERVLLKGIRKATLRMEAGDAAATRAAAAAAWRRGVKAVRKARRVLDLDGGRLDPPPFAGLAPDFSLPDANPNSPGSGAAVSPRDGLGLVTAWYFTRVT
jgi:hypothetical protein